MDRSVPEGQQRCRDCGGRYKCYPDCHAPCERIERALRDLVSLKDGPRDQTYYDYKEAAWDQARQVLGEG